MNKCDCKCINVPCRGVCHGTAALACSAANSERDTVRVPPVVNGCNPKRSLERFEDFAKASFYSYLFVM